MLVDLSPYPLADAVQRISRLRLLVCAPFLLIMLGFAFTGLPRAGGWLLLAGLAAIVPLVLVTSLVYSDRVWLAERGLYLGGRLYPWGGFERVAWTRDGRAFALRRRGRWLVRRWTLVPVPKGSREAADEALRQVIPAVAVDSTA